MNVKIYINMVILLICGCNFMENQTQNDIQTRYFSSPETAVSIITNLLRKDDFKTLASYYDLSSSMVKRTSLETGEFFIRTEAPEIGHPGGFWRYKHPFVPGFSYYSSQSTNRENVFLIKVMIEIDQGDEFPTQVGFSDFYMIKSNKGWQVLPISVNDDMHHPEMPITTQ